MFNIKNIIIGFGNTINNIFRANLDINEQWFKKIMDKYYDEEIKSKNIPELHQDTKFEEIHLLDIIDFNKYLIEFFSILNDVGSESIYFKDSLNSLNSYLETEEINYKSDILEKDLKFKDSPQILFNYLEDILKHREFLLNIFNNRDYTILEKLNDLKNFDLYGLSKIDYKTNYWNIFLDKEPNHEIFHIYFRLYNTLIGQLQNFNAKLNNLVNRQQKVD